MSNCVDCSGNENPQNPLDCDNQFMQCNNPCGASSANTPQCESLPSQIQNFTDQFFGTVVKTEVNGEVVWSLPCSLDTGLPNNPRAQGEGLACYFLRLFRDGIGGLTGPKGNPGTPGKDGNNTYTVTVQSFVQPTINNPLTQIVVLPNPSIVAGIGVFIQGSGNYQVTGTAPGGVVFVTLTTPVANPAAVIVSGAVVVPVGLSPTGPAGPQGPAGAPGAPGAPGASGLSITSSDNGTWTAFDPTGALKAGIAGYALTGVAAQVVFGAQTPGFTPKYVGTYLVTVVIPVWATAAGGGNIFAWLHSSSTGVFPTTQQFLGPYLDTTIEAFVMTSVITTSLASGEFIGVLAYTNTAGPYTMNAAGAQISWVRLA